MPAIRKTLASNAIANLIRGLSSYLLTYGLPLTLALILPASKFGVWALIFSIASYALYLDVGIVNAVMSLISRESGRKASAFFQYSIVAAASRTMALISVLTIMAAVPIGVYFRVIFPSVAGDVAHVGLAVVFLAAGQVMLVSSNVYVGYFNGRLQAGKAVKPVVVARFSSLALVLSAAVGTADLALMAAAFASAALGQLLALRSLYLGECGDTNVDHSHIRDAANRLWPTAWPLAVWSGSMLFVVGLDLTLVGRLDPSGLSTYSYAIVLAGAVTGVVSAIQGPLLPLFAARVISDSARLAHLFHATFAMNAVAVVSIITLGSPLAVLAVMRLARDDSIYVLATAGCLFVAACLRLMAQPYALLMLATASQRRGIPSALVEAAVNFVFSIVLGMAWGAPGVALGTLIGSVVGLVITAYIGERIILRSNLRRCAAMLLQRSLGALLIASPMLISLGILTSGKFPIGWVYVLFATGWVVSATVALLFLRSPVRKFAEQNSS